MADKTGGDAADRKRLLAILKEKSYERKKVILSSGRESDFYIDCKQATLTAEGAVLTGRVLLAMLEKGGYPEAVGGITLGADPIVTQSVSEDFVAVRLRCRSGFLRCAPPGLDARAEDGIVTAIAAEACGLAVVCGPCFPNPFALCDPTTG